MENEGFFYLSDGDIRYDSEYVKASNKPYIGRVHSYNGWDLIDFLELGTWWEFKKNKLPLPKPEEVVCFEFLPNIGANRYRGYYKSKQLKEMRVPKIELLRKKRIIEQTKRAKREEEKRDYSGRLQCLRDWLPQWKGVVKIVDIRLNGDLKEIQKIVDNYHYHLGKTYELIDVSEPYKNREDDNHRVYIKVTKKRKIYSFATRVAGVHVDGRQGLLSRMTDDTPLFLEREPLNPFDKNAIMVLAEIDGTKKHVGYIHASFSKDISPLMDKGEPIVIKNKGVVTETFTNSYDEFDEWHEYEQKGVCIELTYEDDVSFY
ncbi:HIRAN domain-containing protein [Priestia aryabhattai]|uniref:HIRAN domain-containing protein n=1 Tax=Priestia aryabhattai TaxID=412384 RepID=UPI002E1EC266|nr:HIRAN domain-containing protein [Priestia aryabhattai]